MIMTVIMMVVSMVPLTVVLMLDLGAGRRRHLQIHLQVGYRGQVAQSSRNGFTNLTGDFRLMFREPDEYANIPAINADILYHAKETMSRL